MPLITPDLPRLPRCELALPVYQQCQDIDLQMLRTLVTPWPPSWPTERWDLNAAARRTGAVLPVRAPDHLHPRVHSEWNRQLFDRIQARQGNQDA